MWIKLKSVSSQWSQGFETSDASCLIYVHIEEILISQGSKCYYGGVVLYGKELFVREETRDQQQGLQMEDSFKSLLKTAW